MTATLPELPLSVKGFGCVRLCLPVLLKPFGNPDFDKRLPCNSPPLRFSLKCTGAGSGLEISLSACYRHPLRPLSTDISAGLILFVYFRGYATPAYRPSFRTSPIPLPTDISRADPLPLLFFDHFVPFNKRFGNIFKIPSGYSATCSRSLSSRPGQNFFQVSAASSK